MSLNVIIDQKEVRIPKDFELAITLQNSLFEQDKEDATYPVSINLPSNRHIFGHPDRIQLDYESTPPATIRFGPYLVLDGRAVVTDINNSELELFISTDKHSFWGRAKEKYLDELNLGRKTFSTPQLMVKEFQQSLTEKLNYVTCPLYDENVELLSPGISKTFYNYVNPLLSVMDVEYGGTPCVFVPFCRLNWVIQCALESIGYSVERYDFENDPDFNDILLICRRNSFQLDTPFSSFGYDLRKHVPHITLFDFLSDVEKKFGCVILANENSRTVSVIRPDSLGTLPVEVLDPITKRNILPEDQLSGIIYKDQDNSDSYLEKYKESMEYTYGNEENAETVECISNIVGVDWSEWVNPFGLLMRYSHAAADSGSFEYSSQYRLALNTELRYSVYRGNVTPPVDDYQYLVNYPYASPAPISGFSNILSLLWKGNNSLFQRYHETQAKLKMGVSQEHEFYLHPDMNMLGNLSRIFSNELVIRNRKYLCYEQEITLSLNHIVSHIVRCVPR